MPKGDIGWVIIVSILAAVIAYVVFISLPETPETPEYTAQITRHDDTIKVITDNEGEINADRLWVKFDHAGAIKITNKSEIVGDTFDYDPTEDIEGGDYSISGGEKGVPTYDIHVCVYYSYKDQDKKLINEEILEYRNPNR